MERPQIIVTQILMHIEIGWAASEYDYLSSKTSLPSRHRLWQHPKERAAPDKQIVSIA